MMAVCTVNGYSEQSWLAHFVLGTRVGRFNSLRLSDTHTHTHHTHTRTHHTHTHTHTTHTTHTHTHTHTHTPHTHTHTHVYAVYFDSGKVSLFPPKFIYGFRVMIWTNSDHFSAPQQYWSAVLSAVALNFNLQCEVKINMCFLKERIQLYIFSVSPQQNSKFW